MHVTGVWSVIMSLVATPVVPNTLVTSPMTLSLQTVSMLLVSAVITLMAVWWMVTAVSITQNPTLVTMLRSTEICISLVTEAVYWGHPPDALSCSGSFIVSDIETKQ